jgi:hypothetical protein
MALNSIHLHLLKRILSFIRKLRPKLIHKIGPRFARKIVETLFNTITDKKIAVFGFAFKKVLPTLLLPL